MGMGMFVPITAGWSPDSTIPCHQIGQAQQGAQLVALAGEKARWGSWCAALVREQKQKAERKAERRAYVVASVSLPLLGELCIKTK